MNHVSLKAGTQIIIFKSAQEACCRATRGNLHRCASEEELGVSISTMKIRKRASFVQTTHAVLARLN